MSTTATKPTRNAGMTRQRFLANAKPIMGKIGEMPLVFEPKAFSTGSVGYGFSGKIPVQLPDGSIVQLQVSANATAIGSKEWTE